MKELAEKKVGRPWYVPILDFFNSLYFALKYVTIETIKRSGSTIIGMLTVIIVVFVVSFLAHAITKTSLVFFKLSEDQTGDADVIMMPLLTNSSFSPFLNHTDIDYRVKNNSLVWGTSPRWTIFGSISNRDDMSKNTSGIFLLIDSKREPTIGEGRFWSHRPLGETECHVKDTLLRAVDLPPNQGSKVILTIELTSILKIAGLSTGGPPALILASLLQQQGVNLTQTVSVDIVALVDQFGVPISPIVRTLLEAGGPVQIPLSTVFNLLANSTGTSLALSNEYSVVDSIVWNEAKYTSALGNVVIFDSTYFVKNLKRSFLANPMVALLIQVLGPGFRRQIDAVFDAFKLEEYALQVIAQYRHRYATYVKPEEEMNQDFIAFTNSIVDSLGVDYPVTLTLPIVGALGAIKFISLFLDQIFIGVVVMIAVLGIILIYTILIGKVEEKTYEYGMLRALGLPQNSLIQVILAQSMYFAIPGVGIGMIVAWGIGIAVNYLMGWYSQLPDAGVLMGWAAVVVPILLGFFIPIFSNIIPIRRALSRQLRDSLDIAHQSMNDTTVRMIKLAELGLEPWQTTLSILLVVCGFITYYMIPYSFIFNNLPLFFLILNAILLAMLFGLCMVASVVQPLLERIVLFCILWFRDRRLMTLISKNLAGHRGRSRKTFLMFVLAISFIIFAGVTFSLQNASIVSNVEALIGADIVGQSFSSNAAIDTKTLSPYLDGLKRQGILEDYAYTTFQLRTNPFISSTRFSTLAFYPSRSINVFGITKNYLNVARNYYFLYTEYDRKFEYAPLPGRKVDLVDSLYTHQGQAIVEGETPGYQPRRIFSGRKMGVSINDSLSFDAGEKYRQYIDCICSEAMRDEVSVRVGAPLQLKVGVNHPKTGRGSSQDFISKARGMVYKVPGFFFSSYRFASSGSPLLISIDAYKNITQQAARSVDYNEPGYDGEPKYEKVFLKLKPGISALVRTDVQNGLKSYLDRDLSGVTDVQDLVASTGTATTVIITFYNLVAVIAILLCFFTLSLSFDANVRENSWEFGVLRSIGLSVSALIRAYVYEALCLVVSALICGTIIGTSIALTLTAQFNLFLEMPFQFDFPYYLFATLVVMSVIVAILGSYIPSRMLRKQEIAIVIRGG